MIFVFKCGALKDRSPLIYQIGQSVFSQAWEYPYAFRQYLIFFFPNKYQIVMQDRLTASGEIVCESTFSGVSRAKKKNNTIIQSYCACV